MKRWQVHFLGAKKLPEDISGFEIAHFFSFDAETRQAIRAKRNDCQRLGLAVHVGFLRMTGCSLDALETIPRALLKHLGKHLGIVTPDVASLRALYGRRRTLFDHQQWALEKIGLKPFTSQRAGALLRRLGDEAEQIITTAELVLFSRCWLYDNSILIPAERRLQDICRRAQQEAEDALLVVIDSLIPAEKRQQWIRVLSKPRDPEELSCMEWLQQPPKRRSRIGLSEVVEKIDYLKSLGVADFELVGIRLERQQAYASRMRRRRPSRFLKLSEPRRSIELVCWLRVVLMQFMDVALALSGMQTSTIERIARDNVRDEDAELTTVLRSYIVAACAAGLDDELSDKEAREHMLQILRPGQQPLSNQAARVREQLSSSARRTRPLLRTILKLPLQYELTEPVGKAVVLMRKLYESNATTLPADADISFAPSWANVLGGTNRREALRGFEAALLQTLKTDVRRGAVWVDHSLNHRDRDSTLIPEEYWANHSGRLFKDLRIPKRPDKHLKPLFANLKVALEAMGRAVAAGDVVIHEGELRLPMMKAEETPSELDSDRRQLFSEIGTVEWPALITEMDSKVRFSWTLLGRSPFSEKELLSIYGALLAHGTELSAAAVSLTIPGITAESVGQAMHLLEDPRKLTRANQQVVDFLQSHGIAKMWGEGTLASSDAMSLEASRHLWNARVDPRHRRHAVGMYTHVLDQWGIIYDQPIILNKRQAGMAIEGVVRQKASAELRQLAVDTHGFTDFAMAVSKLLGFDLCPRLKNLKNRRLHLPPGFEAPANLRQVVKRDARTKDIEEGWADLVRVVASIEGGWTSGMLALERFGSASRKDPIFKAGTNLGKLYRTLFLCDYFTNDSFRRELLRILSHGESIHTLQRAIYFGSIPVARGRRHDELVAISGSLTLLTNLTMAWMTHKLQGVLDDRANSGRSVPAPEVLRHIAPVHSEGINFRGRFHFPIKTYANRILAA